jgi:GntR family transcriptional regulator
MDEGLGGVMTFSGIHRGGLPAYRQIAQILRNRIANSDYTNRLPTEDELIREFKVARQTVRAAIANLVDDGLLERFPGRGTFVLPLEQRNSPWRIRTLEDILGQRFPEPPKIISTAFRSAREDGHAATALQLDRDDKMFCVVALRTLDGLPYSCSKIMLPGDIGRALSRRLTEEIYSVPMIRAVERQCGIRINRAVQCATAEPACNETARLLEIEDGAAVLVLERTYFTSEGRPIEYVRTQGRSDRYQHTIEFTRQKSNR